MVTLSLQVDYACWTSKNVTATIPTEAATPSDAVLLATHAPLRIHRHTGAVGDDAAKVMTESEVLDEFLTRDSNNGVLVAPIVGESGAGKSHLIRWVNAMIPAKDGRHVVYLQKTETSLKDVIERILAGHHDPALDEIRRKVSSLGSGVLIDEMEHKILSELAEALRTAKGDNAYGKALVGENGLRLFFTDPLFEQHLLRPGSFIKRRAKHALHGRDPDEPDIPLEFTADELPLDIVDNGNILEAAVATQKLFRKLVASAAMQNEAVRLLNEYLDVAVTKAASLNVGDVGHAFKIVREKLVGQEIVLLIEDVALIQGVRRDLLDAIIEVGVIRGEEKYATVRTLMAVTPSYYREQLPETFRRRAEASSPIYQVDVTLNFDQYDSDQDELLVDFVGRYLNAARVGKTVLESNLSNVPNKCHECEFRASCHATFGTSGSGDAEYGLYPYNRPAILRAVRACADRPGDRTDGRILFNPRKVLSRAVRDTLNDSIEVIEGGRFPPAGFLAEEAAAMRLPQLPIDIRAKIEEDYSAEDAGRVSSLLNFWGDVGSRKVSDGVLEAFSHPPLPDLAFKTGEGSEPDEDKPTPNNAVSGLSRSLEKTLDAIDNWSQGQVLPQSVALELRKIVREALLSRIEWYDPIIKDPDSKVINKAVPISALSVSIEGATENLPKTVQPLIRIERNARNATTFKGLAMIQGGHPDRASDALARLDAMTFSHAGVVKRRIIDELKVDDASLVQAVASLIQGAAACGELPTKPNDLDYVNACLWQDNAERLDAAARAPEWISAYQDYVSARGDAVNGLMAGVGAAQGTGGVYAIDIERLLSVVRKAKKVANSTNELEVPIWCTNAQRKLKALLRTGARQIASWQGQVDRIRKHLPEAVSFRETVDAIIESVKNGQDLGLIPVNNLQALQALNTEAREWDARCIRDVERILATADNLSGTARLSSLGTVVGADLLKIVSYLESSSQWVEAGIRTAQSSGGTVADVDTQLKETISTWLDIVKEQTS
ncbi:protein DpdH [Gordonia rubripertincta]|uniref:Protein DpdH n=1 Tax=Gordonia rubripertincta TaxID=36822 RepID=A0ABT4MZ01_GORRU|nr:protein DpdH [Gordonia rubripertincta]MCZ4552240.1 protein DpdH [Gordonia rubripertincta]